MTKFNTYKDFLDYVENNYEQDEQFIIEDFISYYINEYKGYGKYNCKHTYKNNIRDDVSGELHKMALIGFEFEKKLFETNKIVPNDNSTPNN
jgi:hypothetical protein